MTMITPSYLGETIEYSSLHACRSTLEDPTPRGGLLLASQQEEFDALNLEHLERIARIADVLDLYSVQGRKHKV